MKIAVFENEKNLFENIFKAANIFFFESTIEYDWFASSQDIGADENFNKYDIFIVDISLSRQSSLDGYALINKICETISDPKVIVFTGSENVDATLQKRVNRDFPVIIKPPKARQLATIFNDLMSTDS